MHLEFNLAIQLLILGSCTGFLAGLLGIGGGMVLVPLLTFILTLRDFPSESIIKIAVATSLATISFTSMSSVYAHHKRGMVRWDVTKLLAPGIVMGSLIGPMIAKTMPAQFLTLLFAIFVTFSATQMFIDKKPKPTRQLPQGVGMFGAGSLIGTLSALVGAGGGFISVPFMTWCNVKIHNAVATSAALGFPIALAGTVGYVFAGWSLSELPTGTFGFIYLPALLLISLASVMTAPLGARVAHSLNVQQLKRAFAVMLFLLAGYMFYKALHT